MKAQMSIFAPSAEAAKKEVATIAQECGSAPKILDAIPEGKGHYWLVTYTASPETVRSMEDWVS